MSVLCKKETQPQRRRRINQDQSSSSDENAGGLGAVGTGHGGRGPILACLVWIIRRGNFCQVAPPPDVSTPVNSKSTSRVPWLTPRKCWAGAVPLGVPQVVFYPSLYHGASFLLVTVPEFVSLALASEWVLCFKHTIAPGLALGLGCLPLSLGTHMTLLSVNCSFLELHLPCSYLKQSRSKCSKTFPERGPYPRILDLHQSPLFSRNGVLSSPSP